MLSRLLTFVFIGVVVVACGGGGYATPAGSQAPGATTVPNPTPGAVVPGEPIDTAAVQAAVAALQEQDSWQFAVSWIGSGLDEKMSASGTERTTPERAVDADFPQSGGGVPFSYIRIGDQIWYDVGTESFTEVDAANAKNLIDQYEPYYLDNLAQSATEQDFEFDPVGDETVSGVATSHYRLSEADLEDVIQLTELQPSQWAGDVWIAKDGGYLMRLAWGPQTVEDAQLSIGFDYLVTAVNCTCAIEPPD